MNPTTTNTNTDPAPQETTDLTVAEQAAQQLARRPGTVKDILRGKEFKDALREVLPKIMRPERFVRIALTTIMRIPELGECSKPSLFRALLDLSSYGLEPDGRRAHLIPFKNKKMCQCGHQQDEHKGQNCIHCDCKQRRVMVECQLIIDYKGLAELVRRSGDVSYIHADVVYEGDEWDFGFGSNSFLKHKPAEVRGPKRRAFYSFVKLKDGTEDFRVLSPADVEKIRRRSKSPDNGPWVTDYDAMGIKTAFRQHSKWLPLSPDVREAVESDDDAVDTAGTWDALTADAPEPSGKTLADRIIAGEVGPEGQATLLPAE
jgi:recombination protein RecT